MNETQELKLQLTLGEINQILAGLGNAPYREVYQLIAKIQTQAEAQLQPPEQGEAVVVEKRFVNE